MRKSDLILIVVLLAVAGVAFLLLRDLTGDTAMVDGTAVVYYNDERILTIDLEDGGYTIHNSDRVASIDEQENIYHVIGSNPYGVYIQYRDNKVKVIDEESPRHICQTQGWTNSPLQPLTCLPNNIIIVIEAKDDSLPDDITG
jgi:hypothetical protein